MEKPNRAERRKNKFGGGRATGHGGWPTVQPNPVFHAETPTDETAPVKPDAEAQSAPEKTAATANEAESTPD